MRLTGPRLATLIVVLLAAPVVGGHLARKAWPRETGTVWPSTTSRLTTGGRIRVTHLGGTPWEQKGFGYLNLAVYHAVIQLPRGAVEDLYFRKNLGPHHVLEEGWRVTNGTRAVDVEFRGEYHARGHRLTIGGRAYRLSEGNVFVVRYDDQGGADVTQLPTTVAALDDRDSVLDAAAAGIPDDAALQEDLRGIIREYQLVQISEGRWRVDPTRTRTR